MPQRRPHTGEAMPDDWVDRLKADLVLLRKDDGLNPERMGRCSVLPDLECVRRRLDGGERDDRALRVIEAVQMLRSEILLLRTDEKGEVMRREFAIGLERHPKDLGERRIDLASERSADHPPIETIRRHGDQMLRTLHAHMLELERRARSTPESLVPPVVANAVPYEWLVIDAVYRFSDSRVPDALHDSRVLRARADACRYAAVRQLYTGGSDGIELRVHEGAEPDPDFEERTSATGLRVHRLRFPPLARGEVQRIVLSTVVLDRVTLPTPFVSIALEAYAETVRIKTEFPRGDVPPSIRRFVGWSYEVPIPLDNIPYVEILVENGVAECRFDKVDAGLAVGMTWVWP